METSYIDAINRALHDALEADKSVFLYGQDIAEFGGAFKATKGLHAKFSKQVFDAPISEDAMVGMCVGASTQGKKPVLEMQFADFASVGYNQVINQAGTLFYRTGVPCSIVIRLPYGGTPGGGPFHSQCPEAIYAHYPGLLVVAPSNPDDAYSLLREAIDNPNPVIFLEHKYIYQRAKTKNFQKKYAPNEKNIGKAKIIKPGKHATVVTYGAMILEVLSACEKLEKNGYEIEIIDLRTVKPIDTGTILASVARTGRVLTVSESFPWGGTCAEITTKIANEGFNLLDAPPLRLTAKDTPIPYHPDLWQEHRPNVEQIAEKLEKLLSY